MVRDHLHFDWVSQIGLVASVPKRRVAVADLGPVRIYFTSSTKLFEHTGQNRLDRVEHVLLLDKRHFQIQLIEISGRAVSARVFVAETGRNLKVLVITRNHNQLFELLWRLGQRIEFSGVQT